ncbi:MAG TPA: FAD-dependent monooxygenase [Anaeromyxobacteraceae bacterium]|jgi:flavin-dependent dehydrogenase
MPPEALRDVVVAGGGPAGLAVAAAAAARGLDVVVLERGSLPADKACGEGLLPAGLGALEELGALKRVPEADRAPIRAIRWIDGGGAFAEAALPGPAAGIRRTALSAALLAQARAAGAEVRERTPLVAHRRGPGGVVAETPGGRFEARLLVAADGLASPVREREGLSRPERGAARFGFRRHFALAPWSDRVEVHLGDGAEAYVTPAGAARVGVALLCEAAARRPYQELLAGFPALAGRLAGARHDSAPAGAGPLRREAAARVRDRLVLVGDAAGFVDAISGEGLSLALAAALDLARALPAALARGAPAEALREFERAQERRWRRYAAATHLLLWLARRPGARRRAIAVAARHPRALERMVAWAVGQGSGVG